MKLKLPVGPRHVGTICHGRMSLRPAALESTGSLSRWYSPLARAPEIGCYISGGGCLWIIGRLIDAIESRQVDRHRVDRAVGLRDRVIRHERVGQPLQVNHRDAVGPTIFPNCGLDLRWDGCDLIERHIVGRGVSGRRRVTRSRGVRVGIPGFRLRNAQPTWGIDNDRSRILDRNRLRQIVRRAPVVINGDLARSCPDRRMASTRYAARSTESQWFPDFHCLELPDTSCWKSCRSIRRGRSRHSGPEGWAQSGP